MVGKYYKTLSRNWETGDTVFLFSPQEPCTYAENGVVKCDGKIGLYIKNLPMQIEGKFNEKKEIFEVFSDCLPSGSAESTDAILSYVTDDLTDGQREKIIKISGNDLFAFVEKKSAADEIMNIFRDNKRASRMAKLIIRKVKKLKEQEMFSKEMMSYGMSVSDVETLINKEIFFETIDKDPYIIMLKFGIPIDVIEIYAARRLHLQEYHIVRLAGFLYDSMLYCAENGHTCVTPRMLLSTMNMRLKYHGAYNTVIDLAVVNMCVMYLDGEVIYKEFDGVPYIYIQHIWDEECTALRHVQRLQKNKKEYHYDLFSVSDIESETGFVYNKGQRQAFQMLGTSGIKILTGPPGSGKTAVINGLIRYFIKNRNGKVKLSATTGMASKVMAEACGNEAETVNLMLNVRPYDSGVQGRNLNNPVDADFIIVDEISMLGLQLFSILAGAVTNDSILLLVGDEDQLLSIEYGNILHDLINSGCVEVCRLTEILRQSGTICDNAKKINHGCHSLVTDDTFFIKKYLMPEKVMDDLERNFKKGISQILTPTKHGSTGTFEINRIFQDEMATIAANYGKKTFRIGDKIIMTRTDYDAGYTNGDIGYIIGKNEDQSIVVKFSSGNLTIPRKNLCDMELGEAITIHKSQGSEFDDVHIILPVEAVHMITRRILYTGVTRAKKHVFIYAVENMLDIAIDDRSERSRTTLFGKRLKNFILDDA